MSQIERGLRRSVAFLAFVALTLCAALPGWAKDSPAEKVPALPQPLTKESIRELVSRLSDDDVRKLLLDQLDRAAVAPANAKPKMGMSSMVNEHAGEMRTTLGGLEAAYYAFPDTLRQVRAKLTEPDGTEPLTALAGLLVAMLVGAFLVEWVYRRALRRFRTGLDQTPAATYSGQVFKHGVGLLIDLGAILVWTIAAISTFFLLWHEHELRRTTVVAVIIGAVIVRTTMLIARFLLSPRDPSKRLLPFTDAPARTLYGFAVVVATIYAIEMVLFTLLRASGADQATLDLTALCPAVVGIGVTIWTVWSVREPIADLIRGEGARGTIRYWTAELWPHLATLYFLGVLFARVFDVLAGEEVLSGQGIFSILLLVAIPIVDMALCHALAAGAVAEVAGGRRARIHGILHAYESVFRRAIHIVVIVVGLVLFSRFWGLNLFAFAEQSMGGKISSSLLGILIVLLLAYMIWEGAKAAIDRRLAAEGELDPEAPASRLRTVLPLLRALIAITVFVMATMSVLAALGVDILPLLAGASVVGVAVGFGSQTLVRDIVSGAFFLMDDAFRLGEYIEVGDAKGRVEKINVRSLFLRHHRGAINILPYGEIKRLRNTNRDWMIMVMDFRLTYDTNLALVKKILKQVGDEIAADPELKPDLLQPLKMGGVMSTEDSAIVVRAKFTARPEGEPYMIQKAAYTKILKAFREAGIKFAHKQVTVNVPVLPNANDEAMAAAAGAAALAAAASTKPKS
ncbi:MAG TPA: mechanosensitive ion channel family protein [Casimicrobiaceae bacterium]|nr:mechanosensitive ion channel family protein [Casimicrobiaceae bacterium]